jgi:predicted DCC family thiol-disulfide oxidoreductase YuxK
VSRPDRPDAHAKCRRFDLVRFVSRPASPLPLGVLRIGVGLLMLAQTVAVLPHLSELYGSLGLVQAPVVDELVASITPRVSWLARAIAPLRLDESVAIRIVVLAHLLGCVALTLGWRTRAASVSVWLTNLTLSTSASPHTYGVDTFLKIILFYGMFAPLGSALSLDVLAGRASGAPSFSARLALRFLQAHLALVYAATGIEKAMGVQWWSGEALWRSWMRADLAVADFGWVAWAPWVARVGCWATLLVEIGYAIFVWPSRTRKAWALATLGLHLGIGLTLGLWAFALLMMLLTFSAWLVPAEPRSIAAARRSGLVVAFDGSCRACRAAVGLAWQLGSRGFVPAGRRGDGCRTMATVASDGRTQLGVDAFLATWAHATGRRRIEKLGRLAWVRGAYALFAKHRRALGCRGRCALP